MKQQHSTKLKGKDLITIGIFSAIYFVLSFACNMIGGIHAIVWFLTPAIAAVICATPFLVLASKVKKPFAVLILSVVVGLIYLATGQFHIAVPLTFICGGIIAEFIRYLTKYKSYLANTLSYMVVSLGMAASPIPLWLDSDAFIKQITDFGMPQSYIDTCKSLTSPLMLVVIIITTLICAFLGSLISKILFNKHFKKAGIVG